MEKVMPSFEYEPLILSLKLKTSYGDIDGVGPLSTRVIEEPGNFRGGKDIPRREAVEQIVE
jgi:hypothetical protein